MSLLQRDIITLVFFLILIILFLGTLAYGAILAAPWVPLRRRDVKRILRAANVQPGNRVYDLGSGDGRILIAAAKDFGAQAVGFEVALLPYLLSRVKIYLNGVSDKTKVLYRNFYKQSLAEADVVTAFLTPMAMGRLEPKFRAELKPGARVVTYAFKIPGWTPDRIDKQSKNEISIFYYTKK